MESTAKQAQTTWEHLKELTRQSAEKREQEFGWGNGDGVEFLKLDYVAATFLDGYRIYFSRKAEKGMFPGSSQISSEEWFCEPKITTGSVVWSVRNAPKFSGDFSANQLAENISERLIQYHNDYTEASAPY